MTGEGGLFSASAMNGYVLKRTAHLGNSAVASATTSCLSGNSLRHSALRVLLHLKKVPPPPLEDREPNIGKGRREIFWLELLNPEGAACRRYELNRYDEVAEAPAEFPRRARPSRTGR